MISSGDKCVDRSEGCESKSDGQRWRYLTVKELSASLRGITKGFCNVIVKRLKYYNLINIKNLLKHQLLLMQILNV